MKKRNTLGMLILGMILFMAAAPCQTFAANGDEPSAKVVKKEAVKTIKAIKVGSTITFAKDDGTTREVKVTKKVKREFLKNLTTTSLDCMSTYTDGSGQKWCCWYTGTGQWCSKIQQ